MITAVIMLTTAACQEEKKMNEKETIVDINSINKANNISLQTAVIINEVIAQIKDSNVVNVLTKHKKKHHQIDTVLKSLAQQNLIVLSDTVFKRQQYLKNLTPVHLVSFLDFLEEQKEALQSISELNHNPALQNYYQLKIAELENNISELSELVETQHKSNY